jgi:hypothetical protein
MSTGFWACMTAANAANAMVRWREVVIRIAESLSPFSVMLESRDMSKVQGPDEGNQGAHLPHAAEVEMSEIRQSGDAEAKIKFGRPVGSAHRLRLISMARL